MLRKFSLFMLVFAFTVILSMSAFAKWDRTRDGDLEGYIRGISFINENQGWAVGDTGVILSTSDGGAKWEKAQIEEVKEAKKSELYTDLYSDLYDVHFVDDKNGWACGDLFKGSGVILRTKDGGKRWERQNTGTSVAIYGIFFIDAKNGWAVGGNGTVIGTNNGGDKWTPLIGGKASSGIGEGDPGYWDVCFVTPQKGWIVGENGVIKMTADGGKTWVAQNSGTDSNLSAVCFVNENAGWAVGEGAALVATTDGGKTWKQQNTESKEEWFYGVAFVSDKEGFVVGDYSTILHTTDGGKTWKTERSGKQKGVEKTTFYDISFPKPNVAFAAAQWGLILKYTQ